MASEPVGIAIKKRRQVLGMTQADLARSLGVSKSTVANWESGKHFPLRKLGAVEQVLGVNLSDPGGQAEAFTDPDEARIWNDWQHLDEAERLAMINGLREERRRPRRPASST